METDQKNFHSMESELSRQEIERCGARIEQVSESVEQVRSDVKRTKSDVSRQQDEHHSHVRRIRALWVFVILLIGGLAVLAWRNAPMVGEHRALLASMPALQTALNDMGTRFSAAEGQIGTFANERLGFTDRMAKIESTVSSSIATVRNEARILTQQVRVEMGQAVQAVQNRLAGVESIQRENSEEVARLQNELVTLKNEMAGLRTENARQFEQVEQARQSTQNDLVGLDRRFNSTQTSIDELEHQVARRRVDFELEKGRTKEVAPGIYLTVNRVNVQRQQVNGWLQVAADGVIVHLKDASAQKPIPFASRTDARSYQLIFTRVGDTGIPGYLMVPNVESGAREPAN